MRNWGGIKMEYVGASYFPMPEEPQKTVTERLSRERRARGVELTLLIAFAQFVIIVLLLSGISAEYQSNPNMQAWIAQNAWPIGYLLNGYLASTLVGVAIGGAVLLLQKWRSDRKQ
jgi:hypothetical protein